MKVVISMIHMILVVIGWLPMISIAAQKPSHPPPLSIGQVAVNLMEPVSVASDFIHTGCIILGVSFLFASLIKYIEHCRSPLMTPISTVLFLLIAGIILILLPLTSLIVESGVPYSLMK